MRQKLIFFVFEPEIEGEKKIVDSFFFVHTKQKKTHKKNERAIRGLGSFCPVLQSAA